MLLQKLLLQKLLLLTLLLQQLVTARPNQINPPVVQHSVLDKIVKPVPPSIAKVEPIKGVAGTRVTIYGAGFSRDSNVIYTGAGEVAAASSDGETLSFTLPRPPFLTDQWLANTAVYRREHYGPEPISFPLGFYVKNEFGVTATPGLFSLLI